MREFISFLILTNIITFSFLAFTVLDEKKQTIVNDGYGDYVLVRGGKFKMGDNFGDGSSDEKPVHLVNLSPYYIGKYEVTNGEYEKFIDDRGYEKPMYWDSSAYLKFGRQPRYWKEQAAPKEG